jgi:N-carbamoyl-L-amino-acid hydrolase
MAEICATSMIFVPSLGGKSHCPEEDTQPVDLARGCEVLVRTLLGLAA